MTISSELRLPASVLLAILRCGTLSARLQLPNSEIMTRPIDFSCLELVGSIVSGTSMIIFLLKGLVGYMRLGNGLALRVEHCIADLYLIMLWESSFIDESVLFLVNCSEIVSILHLLDSGGPL